MNNIELIRVRAPEVVIQREIELKEVALAWDACDRARDANKRMLGGTRVLFRRETFGAISDYRTKEEQLKTYRQQLDRQIWRYLLEATELGPLMGSKQRQQFERELEQNIPAATLENIAATFVERMSRADEIFAATVISLFERLRPRFKSNEGFGVESRRARMLTSNDTLRCGGDMTEELNIEVQIMYELEDLEVREECAVLGGVTLFVGTLSITAGAIAHVNEWDVLYASGTLTIIAVLAGARFLERRKTARMARVSLRARREGWEDAIERRVRTESLARQRANDTAHLRAHIKQLSIALAVVAAGYGVQLATDGPSMVTLIAMYVWIGTLIATFFGMLNVIPWAFLTYVWRRREAAWLAKDP